MQRRADRLCSLILIADYPAGLIDAERRQLRAEIAGLFPGKLELYDMIYEGRFRRLREQFRQD
jgi:hypothetical protein